LLKCFGMTRSYRPRRITRPIAVARRPQSAHVTASSFACFRLVPTSDGLQPVQLAYSSARMAAFVTGDPELTLVA
jgi:hypothetical protein